LLALPLPSHGTRAFCRCKFALDLVLSMKDGTEHLTKNYDVNNVKRQTSRRRPLFSERLFWASDVRA